MENEVKESAEIEAENQTQMPENGDLKKKKIKIKWMWFLQAAGNW